MPESQNSNKFKPSAKGYPFNKKNLELGCLTQRTDKIGREGNSGARNRTSAYISLQQAESILSALKAAQKLGKPANVHKTINFAAMGISDEVAYKASSLIIKKFGDWFRHRGEKLIWCWVRENPKNGGSHVHILMHVPPEMSRKIQSAQWRWLNQVQTKFQSYHPRYSKGRVCTKAIGGRLDTFRTMPIKHADNLQIVVGYILKGASNETLNRIGSSRRHVNGGVASGRRVGRWQQRSKKPRNR